MNSDDSPSKVRQNLKVQMDSNPAVREALGVYLLDLLDKALADAGAVDDIRSLRRAQGRVQALKQVLRDVRADAKTAP
jgi:hypothetical protein